jgi:hypothetical protein
MDAIEMLKGQHREVESLFAKFEQLGDNAAKSKQSIVDKIADALAMHATIEEKHFYPAVKAKRTEDILLEALEEHLGIKRVIADLLKIQTSDETFDAKVKVLKEQVEHHERRGVRSLPQSAQGARQGRAYESRRHDGTYDEGATGERRRAQSRSRGNARRADALATVVALASWPRPSKVSATTPSRSIHDARTSASRRLPIDLGRGQIAAQEGLRSL